MSDYKFNIRIVYILSFLNELYFPITMWLFYYLRFLDFKQIAVLTAVRVLAGNVFEIPTGAFADVVGRKVSVFLSFLIYTVTMFVMGLTSVFGVFVILEILRGLSNALFSGSLEALAYDTLKEQGKENDYDHVIARMETYAWIGLFIAAVAGGFIYHYSFSAPYFLQTVVFAVGTVMALLLYEPKLDSIKYEWKMLLKQNLMGFKELFRDGQVAFISMVFIIIGAGYFTAASLLGISQAKEYGMDARSVGILFACGYVISALSSHFYPGLKRVFGSRKLLIVSVAILLSSFVFAKFAGIAIGALLIIMRISSSTIFNNTRSVVMNRYFSSRNRATAISTIVLLSQLPFVLLSYFIGDYVDQSSPNSLALVLGIAMAVLLGITFLAGGKLFVRTTKLV